MPARKIGYVTDDYRTWGLATTSVAGRDVTVASKPGVFAHGVSDTATLLLAEHLPATAATSVVLMNLGNGLAGAALSRCGKDVVHTERNALGLEATVRTLAANGVPGDAVFPGHGSIGLPAGFTCGAVGIRIPHEKLALTQLLHDALELLEPGGQCFIAGATNEGIKSAARIMEQLFGNAATVATASGSRIVASIRRAGAPAIRDPLLAHDAFHEQAATLGGETYTFSSRPGMFSWDHIDEATSILVDHMDVRDNDRVLDLGCGYGVLGTVAGRRARAHPVTMVDVDFDAIRAAARSAHAAELAGVRVFASDVASAVLREQFDLVVTNPPFHLGKSTDLSVPIQFIHDAWSVLAPGGRLNLVANRTLPYEGAIKWLFRNITTVHDGRRFKVLSAVKPAG